MNYINNLPEILSEVKINPLWSYYGEPYSLEILFNEVSTFLSVISNRMPSGIDVELGDSKFGGSPHLPAHIVWPKGYYFFAQLNMKDIKPLDLSGILPYSGIFYIFLDLDLEKYNYDPTKYRSEVGQIFYFDGDINSLNARRYMDREFLPYNGDGYFENFENTIIKFDFKNGFKLTVEQPPNELIASIASLLKIEHIPDHGSTLFGKSITMNGEDELELFSDLDWDSDEYPQTNPNRFLLFQYYINNVWVHFWAYKDEWAQGNYSRIETTFSS